VDSYSFLLTRLVFSIGLFLKSKGPFVVLVANLKGVSLILFATSSPSTFSK